MWVSSGNCALRELRGCANTWTALAMKTPKKMDCYYSTEAVDYQYLQRSTLPMNHFQSSLPRLPIPSLEKTCQRYLNAQEPLLSSEEYKRLTSIVSNFKEVDGKSLDKELRDIDKQNKHTSYITGPWFDMYLKDRRSTVLTHNPCMVFTDDPNPQYNQQLLRATNMLVSSLRFLRSLRAGLLEPDVFHLFPKKSDNMNYRKVMTWTPGALRFYASALYYKAFPLDMSQFVNLFNSTRIPELSGKDTLLADPTARHMMVLRNGNFYIFDVLDEQGYIKTPDVIHACLDYILKDSIPTAASPLGILTTLDRDSWAKYRKELLAAGNHEQLKLVDTAAFCLTLDDHFSNDHVTSLRNFLHGDGTNRWFDKSFQLIIVGNGQASLNFEHSWGDGVAVLRYINEVFKDSTQRPLVHPGDKPAQIDASRHVQCLKWNIPDSVKNGISDAKLQFDKRLSALTMDVLECPGAGKKLAKKEGISPDALMQMIFQVAYHRMTGNVVATYESCSTAAFKHGRTETMRPATMATKALSEALNGKNKPSTTEVRAMVQQCSKVHSELTKNAAMGQGFDRHLFGLRKIAEARGGKLPALYTDSTYANINHNILSTSTLSSPAVLGGGFAPVVQNGLGIGYGILDERLGCIVTSHPGYSNGKQFLESMGTVVEDIISSLAAGK